MPEIRKDPIFDRWVIVAPERSKRPQDYRVAKDEKKESVCPFCEGNEGLTPPEIMAFRAEGSAENSPGWWVRVVPNKYPALSAGEVLTVKNEGLYTFMGGAGTHEVIIESRFHRESLDGLERGQIVEVFRSWRERLLELRRDNRLKYIQIFKNVGAAAGASLEHTHSQIIALPLVPLTVSTEIESMKKYYSKHGKCIICEIVSQEIKTGSRVVLEGKHFLCFTPFAARFPFEMWIVPVEHGDDFALIKHEQMEDLSVVMGTALKKLSKLVENMPYNIALHTCPVNVPREGLFYHWYIEIMPRITVLAGFELGTGWFINPTPPELAAAALRDVPVD